MQNAPPPAHAHTPHIAKKNLTRKCVHRNVETISTNKKQCVYYLRSHCSRYLLMFPLFAKDYHLAVKQHHSPKGMWPSYATSSEAKKKKKKKISGKIYDEVNINFNWRWRNSNGESFFSVWIRRDYKHLTKKKIREII